MKCGTAKKSAGGAFRPARAFFVMLQIVTTVLVVD